MVEAQLKLYELLKEVEDICKRNDVEYYLAGGAALGAVREGAFLPWDDDIDFYITEKNWQKLIKVMETETPDNRVFVCVENDPYYRNVVGRYVDKESTMMMRSQMVCGKACGQLVEFFVFDPMPLDEEGKWKHRQNVKMYSELLNTSFVVNRNIFYENPEFDFNLYMDYVKRCDEEGEDVVLNELLTEIKSHSEEEADSYCMRWGQKNIVFPKEMFGKPRYVKCEDDYFPVPCQQERLARVGFGDDWMYIPSNDGKIVHGLETMYDTPFQKYVDLYMSVYDKDEIYKVFQDRKKILASTLYNDNVSKLEMTKARVELALYKIKNNLPNIDYLNTLLDEEKYDEIKSVFSYYFEVQNLQSTKANGIYVDIGDDYLYVVLMAYIMSGEYYKVSTALKFRMEKDSNLGEDLTRAKNIFDFCRNLSIAVYDEFDTTKTEELLSQKEEYKDVLPDYTKAQLWLIMKNEDYDQLKDASSKAMEKWQNDGEIIRFYAYACHKLSDDETAKNAYIQAVTNTRNGYVWREARELYNLNGYELVDERKNAE